uniref:NADP-dependent oxidoreductase domain-containing protein n=1 Tax=Photinus pyralis TaxID=7054 RepID=A0A1Y1LN60_PHOPY
MASIPKVKLNNGVEIPILGFGTAAEGSEDLVKSAVMDAIDVGYRHFDCAHVYLNQKKVGEAITEKISQGVVTRGDLFITGKLWNTYHRPESVEAVLRADLKEMNLEYFDLYLIHWPFGFKEGESLIPSGPDGIEYSDYDYTETWRAMEEIYSKGLAKAVGVSNFNQQQIERVLQICTVSPAMNQVECHPYLNQKKLKEFCASKGIVLTAYSPLGTPTLEQRRHMKNVLEDTTLNEIAKKYNKSAAQIAIRYQIERGVVVIPKSFNKKRQAENFGVFDFHLPSEDVAKIDGLNENLRFITFIPSVRSHKFYPFSDMQ